MSSWGWNRMSRNTGHQTSGLVVVDRAAVAAGDDGAPHAEEWSFPPDATVTDLMIGLASGYFPEMGMWSVRVMADGQPQALMGIINYELAKSRSPHGPLITPVMGEAVTLAAVATRYHSNPLIVLGGYSAAYEPQLATVERMRTTHGYTGATHTVLRRDFFVD